MNETTLNKFHKNFKNMKKDTSKEQNNQIEIVHKLSKN